MRNRRLHTILASLLLLAYGNIMQAQTHYSCDFEDAQECNKWTRNAGTQGEKCENKWYIGSIGNFDPNGRNGYGLYISSDEGKTSSYTTKSGSSVVVYREIQLQEGDYFLDFDWRALGAKNASIEVFWTPSSLNTNSNPKGQPSGNLRQYKLGGDTVLYGSISWQSIRMSMHIDADKADGKLVFIWNCARNGAVPNLPAGCIDNINITPYSECEKPEWKRNAKGDILAYNNNTATLSWKGNGQGAVYQVRDYNMEDGKVVLYDSISQDSVQLKTYTEGYHVFSVRTLCGENSFSEWISTSVFIWIPGNRCVDYMDLDKAKCYYGEFANPFVDTAVFDKGYASMESRHTIHYVKGETDPRTENKLYTVPEGEIASVRLGNWNIGAEAEAIEYEYTVQAGQSDIMELKYAVVLEKPGHGESNGINEDPQFLLNIYDQTGKQIEPSTCFSANFAGSSTGGGVDKWNRWLPASELSLSTDTIVWKNWTTLSVSLRKYIGQTLKFRFTTKDCLHTGHFGYAYFTIGCRSGDLEGIACGDFDTDHFEAPEGFNYEWRKVENDSVITENGFPYVDGNVLHIDKLDTCIYAVEVISKLGDHCSYTLTANPNPRFPKAKVTGKERVENCTNYVDFTNASHIYFINRKNGSLSESKEPVEDMIWDFGDGYPLVHSTASTITHQYPSSGGKFTAKAIASMSNGVCQDTVLIEFELPDLSAGTDTHINKCVGEEFTLPTGVVVTTDTIYTYGDKNQYGCDADSRIIVRFHKQKNDTVSDEICEGEIYVFEGDTCLFDGKSYDTPIEYTKLLTSVAGCDSLRVLYLTVHPQLQVDSIPDTLTICADERVLAIPYNYMKGQLDGITVRFDTIAWAEGFDSVYTFSSGEEIRIPMPDKLTPGDYPLSITFVSSQCPLDPIPVIVHVRYASSVIAQKDDLIALLNEANNGGYSWIGYQWYCNDTLIVGAETSFIVVDDSHKGDEYYCLLTDENGVTIATCPIIYGNKTPIENVSGRKVYPTWLSTHDYIHIEGENEVILVDVLGNKIASYSSQESHFTIPAPSHSGLYFLLNTKQIIARIYVH